MSTRKFAIAGTITGYGTVLYWTGRRVMKRWTQMGALAKTWAKRETAESWLPSVTPGRAMENLRVVEVAP